MKIISSHQKKVAIFLLFVMSFQLFTPLASYALTSGPSQPEMKGFEPIGNSDMVDLFSGDFSYNIPLLDVGGYPVNLAYHSGASLDDESSWVGYGWSLNVGSINRQLRGLPDDFNGTDEQERELHMKDHITVEGRFTGTLDLLGIPVPKINKKAKKKKLNLTSPSISIAIKNDNYRGIGVSISANAGLSLTTFAAGDKTNRIDTSTKNLGLKLGATLSSFDGASFSVNRSILSKNLDDAEKTSISKSIGFGYNTRAGLTGMTLANSMSTNTERKNLSRDFDINSSSISFNAESYTPTIDHPTKSNTYTFNLNVGPQVFFAYLGLGIGGTYSKQSTAQALRKLPSYGSLYSEKGKDDPYALMDINREKDIPYSQNVKYLPIPVPSYDLFTASSQDGGGQYHIYRGSSGVFFDPRTETDNKNYSLGIEVGAGAYFDVGADLYYQTIKTKTQKWVDRNKILSSLDFQTSKSDPSYEPTYFKRVGESTPSDDSYLSKIKGTSALKAVLTSKLSNAVEGAEVSNSVSTKNTRAETPNILKRDKREVRNTTFGYLTASEAQKHALDKYITDYNPDSLVINSCNTGGIRNSISRTSGYRKGHHISEVTITGDDGKRSVYGIPVYNTYQKEVSFSVGADLSKRKRGLIGYTKGVDDTIYNTKGRENYYSKEVTKPYATSYLLTAILSPDYIDKTGNGITDDDQGTAVKFGYTKLDGLYKWRTPFAFGQDSANYNEGFLSDNLDDKASYVYGEKEVWYLHSIESKTMVAQFVMDNRNDALGVLNDRGGVDTTVKLKYLKEIRLYSKSDLAQHGNNPLATVPIKVVHFVYDYSICKGLPNSIGNAGKLTLLKVYFTFAQNNKGVLNPYQFSYDTTNYNRYNYRQYDRWGTFKDAAANPNGLNNSEFPYTLQDTSVTNKFISVGQLNKILLPSGGIISVKYESDDYSYVQDRRASEMFLVKGINTSGDSVGLINAQSIYVDLPTHVNPSELRERYFENIDKLYFKFLLDLDGLGHKEFVPGYAQIKNILPATYDGSGNVSTVEIQLEKIGGKNPIAKAGWQFLRMNLPKYAYPGSDNLEDGGSSLKKVLQALVAAFGSIKELIQGYDKRAERKGFSTKFDKGKSWVRLCAPDKKKLGGGLRVRRIDISDSWADMSGILGAKIATYSQIYDYTTTDSKGRTISSGVTSYEPMIGNDENPFRQPVTYKQKQFLSLDNYYYIEQPFGESFFPAASVGYSKVSVKSIGTGDAETVNRTGTSVSEFYTAKDYPTKVEVLGLDQKKPLSSKIFKLIGGVNYDILGLSQGYAIELNDMHGKPKSENIYNKSGQNISSVEYFYKTSNPNSEKKQINNDVKVIDETGTVSDGSIGLDVETSTDMRQQTTNNLGVSVKVSGGLGAILFFPLPFFFPGIGINYEKISYRASSTVKIVNRFAIQYKVRKVQNGSSITTENLLWDSETGNVLLTKTQNEFNDPIYSFAYPAHWTYSRMGQAYKNLGSFLTNVSTNANGELSNSTYNSLLVPGDELIDVNSTNQYWVVNTAISGVYANRLIDQKGLLQNINGLDLKLVRSGRRNMANSAIATIISLNNPISGDHLDISAFTKILDAKATVFSEEWSMPISQNCLVPACPNGCVLSGDSTYCVPAATHYPIPPTSSDFDTTICSRGDTVYSSLGSYIYSTYNKNGTFIGTPTQINTNNSFWINSTSSTTAGPLNRCGVWQCGSDTPYNQWRGFRTVISVPTSHTYYIGIAGDNQAQIIVDGDTIVSQNMTAISAQGGFWNDLDRTFKVWHIFPVSLTAGQRTIDLKGWNSEKIASFGAEIYDNTATEIANATSYDNLRIVFSSRDFRGQTFTPGVNTQYTCPSGLILDSSTGTYTCKDTTLHCAVGYGTNVLINPYYTGILGNWRAQSQFAYQTDRESLVGDATKLGSTNIRKSGAYSVFNPFWSYNASLAKWQSNPSNDSKWIEANRVTYFNEKGTEIENRDALNRFSSALFGYLQSLPVAVASNAQYREIAYDGFEDYDFALGCAMYDTCNSGHFNFKKALGTAASLNTFNAHSGKTSLGINGTVILKKSVYINNTSPLYTISGGQYYLGSNELAKGFSPVPGKKYVLSFWIKDGSPRNATTNFQASVNGTSLISNISKWPIVEGWKRIEVPFVLPSSATNFTLQLSSSGQVYIDDIRIHPFDGQMKTFAYDASSQRLMAELDENNFATFYEYDDEGILIRVKKETERGIMTIKETRSSYKKN